MTLKPTKPTKPKPPSPPAGPEKRRGGRYDRFEDLFNLALRMSQDREGVSLQEIMDQFIVSRRTAERMRNAMMRVFTQLHRVEDGERIGRWALPARELGSLTDVSATELTELDAAARRAEADGSPAERAAALRRLYAKVRAAMQRSVVSRVDADLELLMQAEGSAMRPGPRPRLQAGLIDKLRTSILGSSVVTFDYRRAGSTEPLTRKAHPLAILQGQLPYLIARLPGTKRDPTLFRLDRISAYEIGSDFFVREASFKLAEFAARAFGTFQEPPIDVCLRFDPDSAADARSFHFHPTQQLEPQTDGSLLVRFTAGGKLEMIHHILTWGNHVTILAPQSLQSRLLDLLGALAEHHQPPRRSARKRAARR